MFSFDEYPLWMQEFGNDTGLLTKIPPYMWAGILRYIERGILPGEFLQAVIANDLADAALRADDTNLKVLVAYVRFFCNAAPSPCWGSPEKMRAWVERRGMEGAANG